MRIEELRPDTDPASIDPAGERIRFQFREQLPDDVLVAVAEVLRRHPEHELRAYGDADPSLAWLSHFEHVEQLAIDLLPVTSFDALAGLTQLRSLSLGETRSKRPSLAFLLRLSQLEVLRIESHGKDFDAVGDIGSLRQLHLRAPRAKSLDPLRGLECLEVFTMDFGGIRDLLPLAGLPQLRGLQLYQVRDLDTEDLDPVGDCAALEAVSLGALPNVRNLRALVRRPAATLRFLTLERMTGLDTLVDLAHCDRLAEIGLYESRPADGRVDFLLRCPALNRLLVGDVYPEQQLALLRGGFRGDTLWVHGESLLGDPEDAAVRWRAPVEEQLAR